MKKEKLTSIKKVSSKSSKKSNRIAKSKLMKGIELAFSKRAEALVYDQIKKEIAQNPALMNQLAQAEKGLAKGSGMDID